jgi:hypothetical protein
MLLLSICGHTQVKAEKKTDESILSTVHNARDQAKSWIDAWLHELSLKGMNGDHVAARLVDKISDDRERQQKWESLAWSPSNSSLQPGEYVETELGNGAVVISGNAQTAVARGIPAPITTKRNEKLLYTVTAPPAVRSRILMEGLRNDISNYSLLVQFEGKDPSTNVFIVAWKPAWYDARSIYCKYNPRAKFIDLNSEEHSCRF